MTIWEVTPSVKVSTLILKDWTRRDGFAVRSSKIRYYIPLYKKTTVYI